MKYEDIYDPKNLCIINNSWNPAGDVEIYVGSLKDMDDVMAIIEQAFRLQDID